MNLIHRTLGWSLSIFLIFINTEPVYGESQLLETNQNAAQVLGQATFTRHGRNGGAGLGPASLDYPIGVWSDGTRLFVGDSLNHRVLIWNTIPSQSNTPANVVVGPSHMYDEWGWNSLLSYPKEIYSDGTRLFIADAANHRVLIFNRIPTSNNTAPDVILGQLNFPWSVFSDGTRLFISDWGNNRVLIYNSIPASNGAVPDIVVGQPNFSSFSANQGGVVGPNTLSHPGSTYSDGTRLFIADIWNNRVLVFNTIPSTHNAFADMVIGQATMSTGSVNQGGSPSANTLYYPNGVSFDGAKLFISDWANNRILIFNSLPTANNASADIVVGQPNMTSTSKNQGGDVRSNTLSEPAGLCITGTKLLVADKGNNRVLIYNSIPTSNNNSADLVIGQPDFLSHWANQRGDASAKSFSLPGGLHSDGTRLLVADQENHRVLIWNIIPNSNAAATDVVIGQPSMGHSSNQYLNRPSHVFSDGNKLIIGDDWNERFLIYNNIPSTHSATADVILNDADLTLPMEPWMPTVVPEAPSGIFSDGTRLILSDSDNNRVLIYNSIPTSNITPPDVVIGQPDMLSKSDGCTASRLAHPAGVSWDGTRLYIADMLNNRVLIFNGLPTSNGKAADLVIGQSGMASCLSNQGGAATANSLHYPVDVFSDGRQLFVADSENNRVLVYKPIPTTNGTSADVVLGQPNMTSVLVNQGWPVAANTLNRPIGVFSNPTSLYVVDSKNHRVLMFNLLFSTGMTQTLPPDGETTLSQVRPGGQVKVDFPSQTFDRPINLYDALFG